MTPTRTEFGTVLHALRNALNTMTTSAQCLQLRSDGAGSTAFAQAIDDGAGEAHDLLQHLEGMIDRIYEEPGRAD